MHGAITSTQRNKITVYVPSEHLVVMLNHGDRVKTKMHRVKLFIDYSSILLMFAIPAIAENAFRVDKT